MRSEFFDELYRQMACDERLFLVTADMGINLVERFAETYPDRFLNVGIAEQNLIGVCAGLCNAGYKPFAYTISNFLIHRCFEQIRNDLVLHEYPITLVGTSTGYDNGPLGPTHHIVDDWGCLVGLGAIDIYCPTYLGVAGPLVRHIVDRDRPAYVRIAKGGPDVDSAPPNSDGDEKIAWLRRSQDVESPRSLLVTYGSAFPFCQVACEGNEIDLLVFHQLWPLDELRLSEIMAHYERVLVVEDHFPHSGLYGQLCQIAYRQNWSVQIDSRGPQPPYDLTVGSANYFANRQERDAEAILAWHKKEDRLALRESRR